MTATFKTQVSVGFVLLASVLCSAAFAKDEAESECLSLQTIQEIFQKVPADRQVRRYIYDLSTKDKKLDPEVSIQVLRRVFQVSSVTRKDTQTNIKKVVQEGCEKVTLTLEDESKKEVQVLLKVKSYSDKSLLLTSDDEPVLKFEVDDPEDIQSFRETSFLTVTLGGKNGEEVGKATFLMTAKISWENPLPAKVPVTNRLLQMVQKDSELAELADLLKGEEGSSKKKEINVPVELLEKAQKEIAAKLKAQEHEERKDREF